MELIKYNFLWVLLLTETMLSNLGLFSVTALLPLYFLNFLNLSMEQSSFLLFFSAFSLKTSRLIFFPMINRLSARNAFIVSLLVCSIGYIVMGVTHSFLLIGLGLLLVGIGYGTNSILIKVMTTKMQQNSQQYFLNFSKIGIVINLGAAVGPLIGNVIFIYQTPNTIFLFAAAIFLLSALMAFLLPDSFLEKEKRVSYFKIFQIIMWHLHEKHLRLLAVLTIFSGFLYAQIFTSMSIFVGKGLSQPSKVGILFCINAMMVILISIPLSKIMLRYFKSEMNIICFSFFLFFMGFLVLCFWQSLWSAYWAMVLWTVAEIGLLSALNALVAIFCPFEYRTFGFMMNALSLGIGESLGNFIGSSLSGIGLQGHWTITFICMSGVAFLLMLLGLFISRDYRKQV